jgi:RNA polymerase sigma-70 factor, ECF subfamily
MNYDIENLWKEYNAGLKRFIKSKVQNEFDAEDLLQETFLKLSNSADKLKKTAKPESYIYQIARNSIIDYYRKAKDIVKENQELDYLSLTEEEQVNLNVLEK